LMKPVGQRWKGGASHLLIGLSPIGAGALFHTNHFIGPKFGGRSPASVNSQTRLRRIERLLGGQKECTIEEIKAALADHADCPDCICRHVDPNRAKPIMHQSATNHALIMDITNGEAHFAYGNPCESEYQILKVE